MSMEKFTAWAAKLRQGLLLSHLAAEIIFSDGSVISGGSWNNSHVISCSIVWPILSFFKGLMHSSSENSGHVNIDAVVPPSG